MVFEAHLLTGCIAISSLALNMFKLIPRNLHCFQLNVVFLRVLCQGHFYFLYTFFHALIISHSSLIISLFADDTNIFFQHKNIPELTKIVNHELSFTTTWFKANKLTLHPDSINRVEHTKFLGVIIHQNLSWQAHIKAISSKFAKSTGIIIKSRQFFLSNTLYRLYNSLILPYLQY